MGLRILIVDDHPAVRMGLSAMLETASHEICGEAGTYQEALSLLESTTPDLVLLDLSLGDDSGLELIPVAKANGTPCVIYSMHESAHVVKQVFALGAAGYICKREMSSVLLEGIRSVMTGKQFLSPLVSLSLATDLITPKTKNTNALLSERERQAFDLLGKGYRRREIALSLHVSDRTVETYFTRIMEKLALDGMDELRRFSIAVGQSQKTDGLR